MKSKTTAYWPLHRHNKSNIHRGVISCSLRVHSVSGKDFPPNNPIVIGAEVCSCIIFSADKNTLHRLMRLTNISQSSSSSICDTEVNWRIYEKKQWKHKSTVEWYSLRGLIHSAVPTVQKTNAFWRLPETSVYGMKYGSELLQKAASHDAQTPNPS